jgi:hypothetical protein
MVIMLEGSPNKGDRGPKRPLHTVDAPDLLDSPGGIIINKFIKKETVLSYFPSSFFEPIPACSPEVAILEHHRGRGGAHHRHHRAPSDDGPPSVEGGGGDDSRAPTADDYANLVFGESSDEEDENGGGTTSRDDDDDDDEQQQPANVVAADDGARRPVGEGRGGGDGGGRRRRRVSFSPHALVEVHLLSDVPTARDMTPVEVSNLWISRSDLEALKIDAHNRVRHARRRILAEGRGGAPSPSSPPPPPPPSSSSSSPASSVAVAVEVHDDDDAAGGEGNDEGEDCGGGGRCGRLGDRGGLRSVMSAIERESDSSLRGLEHRLLRNGGVRTRKTRRSLIRDVLECQAHAARLAGRFGWRGMDSEGRATLLARVSRERSAGARCLALADAAEDRAEVLLAASLI